MKIKNSPRRGALLLVVLGLLAMFGLVAIALVVLATQMRRSSTAASFIDQAADPPQRTLDEAMLQIVRGTNNPGSVMGPHSLLEAMYGNQAFVATVSSPQPVCNGQLVELSLGSPTRWVGGCVLTVLSSNASGGTASAVGQSSIIVGFNPSNLNPQIPVFENGTSPQGGDTVLINGAPFSGAGLGYNATGGTDQSFLKPGLPLASYGTNANGVYNPPCGANSDYTAADFGHMLLAAQVMNNGVMYTPIPSMYRPEMIQYWQQKGTIDRTTMLRPNTTDHPNFTGSNPNFNPTWDGVTAGQGQWDVDNDGDGVPDSVWVDLGLPVRAAKDGRLYKPLVAILCVDLDGRLNLNAHGNNGQATQGSTNLSAPQQPGGGYQVQMTECPVAGPSSFAGAAGANVFPRGIGYGPGEINLLPLFGSPGTYNYQYLHQLAFGQPAVSRALRGNERHARPRHP